MIKNHPLRTLGSWAALTAALFLLSASGNSSWWSHGPGWLGSIGWIPAIASVCKSASSSVSP